MLITLGLSLGALASMRFIIVQLRKAPLGWEDEAGFHATAENAPASPFRTAAILRRPEESVFGALAPHRL